MLVGLVAVASDEERRGQRRGAPLAFGLALIPFVFIVLAFMSEHPRAPGAVAQGDGLACSSASRSRRSLSTR